MKPVIRITESRFRRKAWVAVGAIVLFIITYILLVLIAAALTAALSYAGVYIIFLRPNWFTVVAGIGMVLLGVVVLIFLLKFLFRKAGEQDTLMIEITRETQPEFFAVLDELTRKAKARPPHKVFMGPGVNASVFDHSAIWNLIFPSRKNLFVGAALVNILTEAEFRAVLAHEFGHFSQRSTRIGTWVYQVNRILHFMLTQEDRRNKNDSPDTKSGFLIEVFLRLSDFIISAMRGLLTWMYKLVNISRLSLAREMEFYADKTAVEITGPSHLASALLRLPLADHAMEGTIQFYNTRIQKSVSTNNIFPDCLEAARIIGAKLKSEIRNGLPVVTEESIFHYRKSRLVIKDQWASHPSLEDRLAAIRGWGLQDLALPQRHASGLFRNWRGIEVELTGLMFQSVEYTGEKSLLSSSDFAQQFLEEINAGSFPDVFNSWYYRRDPNTAASGEETPQTSAEELFSDEWVGKLYQFISLRDDIQTIHQAGQQAIPVTTFEYDGIRYKWRNCGLLIAELKKQFAVLEKEINEHETLIYRYFLSLAVQLSEGDQFRQSFDKCMQDLATINGHWERLSHFSQHGIVFTDQVSPFARASGLRSLYHLEKEMRPLLKSMPDNPLYAGLYSEEQLKIMQTYCAENLEYMKKDKLNHPEIQKLSDAIGVSDFIMGKGHFRAKKFLLEYMDSLHSRVIR